MQLLSRNPVVGHGERLLALHWRWRREAERLGRALAAAENELDQQWRETSQRRLSGSEPTHADRECIAELQHERDFLADELAHIRLALAGLAIECAEVADVGQPSASPA
jgi:hypothetical protein